MHTPRMHEHPSPWANLSTPPLPTQNRWHASQVKPSDSQGSFEGPPVTHWQQVRMGGLAA